jgi:hypothetical protein
MNTSKQITSFQKKVFTQLIWDYNFSPESVLELFNGEREYLGHYTKETLFKKILENFPWFTIVRLFPKETIISLLTDTVIQRLRHKSLIRDYKYAKQRLQKII